MDWLLFPKNELKKFIEQSQKKLGLSTDEIGKLLNISERTLRDWKKEKHRPSKNVILKLSNLSGVKLPSYQTITQSQHLNQLAKKGGKRRCELYGPPGTKEGRSKGGKESWLKRQNDPDLWKKYTKQIIQPQKSANLAEFVGIMLGDGGMTNFQCVIYLNSEIDKDYANYVSELILKLFNIKPSIYKHKKHKVLRVSVAGVNLVKYLTLNGLSVGNKVHLQVGVPEWIWSKPEYIKACVRGLIDTDGSFIIHRYKVKGKKYSYPKISFSNKSEPLLDFVYKGLKSVGFNPKRSCKFEVWIHRQDEVIRYLREIGPGNLKPTVKNIMEGGPDGKAMVC